MRELISNRVNERETFHTVISTRMKVHQGGLSLYSKLDIDYLYMAYADIMAKVRVCGILF